MGKPLALADLSLRERERGLLIGGTESGKSTLADHLGADWDHRYAHRGGRRLIVDSKPRYRGQFLANGLSAKKRYKSWSHGQYVPGAVVVDEPEELDLAWLTGARVAIVQGEGSADIPRLVATVRRFLQQSSAKRPQMAQFDECLDFFHSNGGPKGGDDVIAQIARAGRERGTAALYCSQRTYQIPATLMSELKKAYVFRLDYKKDAKRLQEMGAPESMPIPTEKHRFMYWTKDDYHTVYGPYSLNLSK